MILHLKSLSLQAMFLSLEHGFIRHPIHDALAGETDEVMVMIPGEFIILLLTGEEHLPNHAERPKQFQFPIDRHLINRHPPRRDLLQKLRNRNRPGGSVQNRKQYRQRFRHPWHEQSDRPQ